MTKQIVITGPESSGKTTLAEHLSAKYSLPIIKEYAREYLQNFEGDYTFEDVLTMAKKQLSYEQQLSDELVICDTDLTVFSIWIKEKYNQEVDWINAHLAQAKNKIYLLCAIDLPWQEDALREHPRLEDRTRLFNEYQNLLEHFNLKYYIISGDSTTREKKGKEVIESLI